MSDQRSTAMAATTSRIPSTVPVSTSTATSEHRRRVVVVGSGLAGLQSAVDLSRHADVTIFERLPVLGGEHWQDPTHARLVAQAAAAGVRSAAGTQVIRWSAGRAVAAGTAGGLYKADALVIATGHRPRTRAESRIDGTRCGGVLAATVAEHLQAQRIQIGRRVVILGGGHLTARIAGDVAQHGSCMVVGTDTSSDRSNPMQIRCLPNARIVRTLGMPRIEAVEIEDGEQSWIEPCDALVLAEGDLPYRNVDGAVLPAPRLVFAQRGDTHIVAATAPWSAIEAGQRAAREALDAADQDHQSSVVRPRIGAPA